MKNTVFYTISAIFWTVCITFIGLIWLEYLGGYDFLKDIEKSNNEEFRIYNSDYYGRDFEGNPYEAFSIQHLNPFYMFGLPWTPDAIATANNSVVSLNQAGFRNSFQNGARMTGIFLGGSTAFGSGATSDLTTIPSALNKLQGDYNFMNYGVPSWNSHQEMVAYTKIPAGTKYVISFSGANDFIVALRYCKKGYEFPQGTPESFEYLAAITDNIRGDRKDGGMISRLFPRTRKKLSRLFYGKGGSRAQRPNCQSRILEAADAFIRNQSVVRDLALVRGSGYLLVLQPSTQFLVPTERERYVGEVELRRDFYRYVMASRLCQAADCLDLSETFRDAVPLQASETPEDPNRAIFVDMVHLTDRGYALVAERLDAMIRR